MNVFMRGVVRRTTVGLGALALAAGAAACGGGGDQEPAPEEPSIEEPAGEEGDGEASDAGGEQPAPGTEPSDGGGMFDGDEDPAGSGASDGGDDAETGSELSEEEIGAATERFVEFLEAVESHDAEAACSMLLNPETGQTGDEMPECMEFFEQEVIPQVQGGEYRDLDASMVEPEDNGDGTVTMNLDGSPFGLPMGQGEDGTWYVTADA